MLNPISMASRGLHPIESFPAEILDYKIYFWGPKGYAEAISETGKSFHGVLHKLPAEQQVLLDKMETTSMIDGQYTRRVTKVRTYDGKEYEAGVYVRESVERGPDVDMPPHERYIDIMVRGARHHGIKEEYIT